ncbi:Glutamyl aminopeptidase [Stylophora pistillata]|uniref:Aminopeptidase n=1 Tax=Stylophora pistillata TaxID=50429 RepID=A0A2B4RVA8_STYPI|nr:Glutamyl aminopeptidase [Stylophora pistillata]
MSMLRLKINVNLPHLLCIVVSGVLNGEFERFGTINPETTLPTTVPNPTTRGNDIWWSVRLPKHITPKHYDVLISVDLKKFLFSGGVTILIDVKQATEYILVHTNKLEITSVAVQRSSGGDVRVMSHFWFKMNQFYVIQLDGWLQPGEYIINVAYKSELREDLGGFYRMTYKRKDGTTIPLAATQFSPSYAREAFPCFDEPAMKATFNVTIAHDPGVTAISNMPVYRTEEKDGWKYDYFEKSVVMSTYLVAFAVCDFKHTEFKLTKDGKTVRMYAPAEQIDQVEYASQITDKLFSFFQEYFQIPYALPKTDMIAIPNFIFGAMENWGLITYRDWNLLFKPNVSSAANKQRVAEVVSHEIAHQWFGNLVTMEWWDDFWLNEGFASFMEFSATDFIHPEWKIEDQLVVNDMSIAFAEDGLANSHPIRIPIARPDEIKKIFDSITYEKGACILRMLEAYLGKEIFRKGLKRYLKRFEYANANTMKLWAALREESCYQGRCVDVDHMMNTWTLQMGYPVINIRHSTGDQYSVSQERFLYRSDANITTEYRSPYNYKWFIPLTYITSSAPSKVILKDINMTSGNITWNGRGWIKGNVGQKGFYRVNYDDKNWDALAEALKTDHKLFNISDRGGVIDDAFELARSEKLNYTKALELTSYLRAEEEYVPWQTALKSFNFIRSLLTPSRPGYKYLQKYLVYQAEPIYKRLGFTDEGSHLETFLRPAILEIVCDAKDKECRANASKYFRDWMRDPFQNQIPANFRSLVYYYGIANGGQEEWNFAFDQLLQTSVASERMKLVHGLAASPEPWILSRFLQLSLDKTKIKSSDAPLVIGKVAETSPVGQQIAWDFILKHWKLLEERYGESLYILRGVLDSVTSGFTNEFQLQQLLNFVEGYDNGSGLSSQSLSQVVERVKSNIAWIKRNEKDLENWLKFFFSKRRE